MSPTLRVAARDERGEPPWLDAPASPASTSSQELTVRARGLRAPVAARIVSPVGTGGLALPMLVVHDGPDYDRQASLTRYSAAMIAAGSLPAHRVALLAPAERDEWYSASAAYGRALCDDVLPALRDAAPVAGRPVGMGASLGALAMLHAHRRCPGSLGGLFLQSGSFFVPRFDRHESSFRRYQRIVRFVRGAARGAGGEDAAAAPIVLTCGRGEENVHNNRVMARALAARGAGATLHEVAGGHDYRAWRDALDPYLTDLLATLWMR